MHRSRTSVAPSHAYSPATAVLLNELLKGSISLVIALKRIDNEMSLAIPLPDSISTSSSSNQLHPSYPSLSLMASPPSGGYLNEEEKERLSGPVSPMFSKSRGDFAGGGLSKGGAGVKQSIKGLLTNLSSLRRSPLVAFLAKDWLARFKRLASEIFSPDCWKLSIPAILYGESRLVLFNDNEAWRAGRVERKADLCPARLSFFLSPPGSTSFHVDGEDTS